MGSSVAVQKIAYTQVLEASNSILCLYDHIKNRLFIVLFWFVVLVLSCGIIKRLYHSCFVFILNLFYRGLKNRRKLTELQTEKRGICYQKCAQCKLSYRFIKIIQQIGYLVSSYPPYKNFVWFGQYLPPLHSINWRVFRRVFIVLILRGFEI